MEEIYWALLVQFAAFTALGVGPTWLFFGPDNRWSKALALAPGLGLMLTTIPAHLLVALGYPVAEWAWAWLGAGCLLSAVAAWWAGRPSLPHSTPSKLRPVLWFAALGTLALLAPVAAGGRDFFLLRGNASDYCNYVALANYLQEEPIAWAQAAAPDELGEKDLTFRFVQRFGQARWVTKAVLAWSSWIAGVPTYLAYYGTALFCFLAAGLVLAYWLANLGMPNRLVVLTALSVAAGFWAQVILDNHSFAHMNTLPLFLLLALVLGSGETITPAKRGLTLLLLSLALTLHYPELMPIALLGAAFWGLRRILDQGKEAWRPVLACGLLLAAGVGLACWFQPSLITYCRGQSQLVAQPQLANWYRAMFPFLFRDPFVGIVGLSPLTGCASWLEGPGGIIVTHLLRLVSILGCLALVVALANWFFRWVRHPALDVLQSLSLGTLTATVFFLLLRQRWTAAKAFSFGYPFYFSGLVLFCWLLQARRVKAGAEARPLPVRALVLVVMVLLLGQACVVASRPLLARQDRDFPHYVWHIPKYRLNQDWDMAPFLPHLGKNEPVAIAVADMWELEMLWNALRWHCRPLNLSPLPNWDRSVHFSESSRHLEIGRMPRFLLLSREMAEAGSWKVIAANRTWALTQAEPGPARLAWWRQDEHNGPEKKMLQIALWSEGTGRFDASALALPTRITGLDVGDISLHPGMNFVRVSAE